MKRFFKPKGSPVDPTPYPLGPPAETFSSSAQFTPDKGSGVSDHPPGFALPVPPKQARFLNLGHVTKDNVTPFPLGSFPSAAQPSGTDRITQELVSVDIGQEHESLDKSFSADSKIQRRVSVKANDGRGMFGFSRKEKVKVTDKDRITGKDQGNVLDFERKARTRRASEQPDYGAVHAGYAREKRQIPQDPAFLSVHRRPSPHREPPIKLARQYSHDPPVFSSSAMFLPLPHRLERTANESKAGVLYPPPPLARITSKISGHSSPNDARSSEETEILSLKQPGYPGPSSNHLIAERERADGKVSGGVSAYSGASLQSHGLGHEAHTKYPRPFIKPRHISRGSESSVGQSTAPEGLAVPSGDSHPQTSRSRRSMDSNQNRRSSDNERSGRPSFDIAYESRGGLRSMFSGKGSNKGENEMLQEIEDGKKKKGLFGLSAKFKDKDEDRKYGNKIWKGMNLTGSEHNVVQTDNEHQATPAAVEELKDWARTGSLDRDAELAYPSDIFVANTHGKGQSPHSTTLLSANDTDKREREQATKDRQDRSKDALKIEKRGRERLEKEIAKAEKEADKRKGEMGSVTWAISDLCSKAEGSDYPLILELCERISHSSEEVAKEAARAVRKIIKYGTQNKYPEQEKIMAMKIWLLGCMRCPEKHGFRAQMTSKRFLQSVEPLFGSEKEKTALGQDTFDRLRGTLSHLNYHFGDQKGSDSLRELWIKIKTPHEPEEGYPFGTVDPIYSTTDPMLHQRRPISAGTRNICSDEIHFAILPNEQDQLANLLREILAYEEHAKVLYSALIDATSSDFQSDFIIEEFYKVCVRDQESLVSQLGWANAQAEKAKKDRGRVPSNFDSPLFENRQQDLLVSELERPGAEEVFMKLLAASDELSQALKMYEEMEHDTKDDQEMRYVQEKSRTDTHMNITSIDHHSSGQLGVPVSDGKDVSLQSRSSSPSRYQSYYPEIEVGRSSQDDRPEHVRHPHTAHSTHSSSHTPEVVPELSLPRYSNDFRAGSPTRIHGRVQGPRPITEGLRRNQFGSAISLQSAHPIVSSVASLTRHSPLGLASQDSDKEAGDDRPAMPSAKVLGKRRAEPKENSNFDPNDLWKTGGETTTRDSDSSSSDEGAFHYWELKRPTVYIYDAAKERAEERRNETPSDRSMNARDLTAEQSLVVDAIGSSEVQIDDHATHSVRKPPSSLPHPESGLQRRVSSRWNQWRRS